MPLSIGAPLGVGASFIRFIEIYSRYISHTKVVAASCCSALSILKQLRRRHKDARNLWHIVMIHTWNTFNLHFSASFNAFRKVANNSPANCFKLQPAKASHITGQRHPLNNIQNLQYTVDLISNLAVAPLIMLANISVQDRLFTEKTTKRTNNIKLLQKIIVCKNFISKFMTRTGWPRYLKTLSYCG